MNYDLERKQFKEILNRASDISAIDVAILEKDYHITNFLREISSLEDRIVFKGGTSLSKCYGAINRFSEDVDLGFFGNPHDAGVIQSSSRKSARKRIISAVKEAAFSAGLNLLNESNILSGRDFNEYEFGFESVFDDSMMRNVIIVETSLMTKSYPCETKQVRWFVEEIITSADGIPPLLSNFTSFYITTQQMERTFIDKVFALCDYSLRNEISRNSRHIYDLYKLYPKIRFDEEFRTLVNNVRSERSHKPICQSARAGFDINAQILEIIKERIFERDYTEVTSYLLFEEVPYEEATSVLYNVMRSGMF